jgi:hypothetical protein
MVKTEIVAIILRTIIGILVIIEKVLKNI